MNIDKGIPIPPERKKGKESKYPVADMEVGDSIKLLDVKNPKTVQVMVCNWGKRFRPKKFRGGSHKGHFRIWRVK